MAGDVQNQDLERFVRDFALFQQRFMNGAGAAAVPRPPAGTAAAPAAATAQPARRPAAGQSPRRAA